jgi:hypothetical protein
LIFRVRPPECVALEFSYCEKWFRARKRPTVLLTAAQAKRLHDTRRLYTVVCGALDAPDSFVEISSDYLGVGFLDACRREYLCYTFTEVEPGRIFLSKVVWREFQGDTDQVSSGTSYDISRDGSVRIVRQRFNPPGVEEAGGRVEVSALWEAYPAFGAYGPLLSRERVAAEPSDGAESR